MELLEFDILQSGVVILLLLSAGELLGRLCRGTVPGILLAGVLFVAGCWSGLLPADLQQLAVLAQLTPVAILMTIASMGTSMSKISGSTASARAMQSRCCWPPERPSALFFSRSFTSSQIAAERRERSTSSSSLARLRMPWVRGP